MDALPKSFTQVEGWRESFEAAYNRQEEVRVASLFPEVPLRLCGMRVRPFALRDWTVLDLAENKFTAKGIPDENDALAVVWLLRDGVFFRRIGNTGRIARYLRRWFKLIAIFRTRRDCDAIIDEVAAFIDAAFMDLPGANDAKDKEAIGFNPANVAPVAIEISLCAEVMASYPSRGYDELRSMPLAQFWQWLVAARQKQNPEYRSIQLTDIVNRKANSELNRRRREARKASATHAQPAAA